MREALSRADHPRPLLPRRRARRVAVAPLVLGQRDLLRVAVLLVALPLVSAAVVARTRYRLACTRRLEPGRVAGRRARPAVDAAPGERLPAAHRAAAARGPAAVRPRVAGPRFVLDRVEPRGTPRRWPTRSAPTCAAATRSARWRSG